VPPCGLRACEASLPLEASPPCAGSLSAFNVGAMACSATRGERWASDRSYMATRLLRVLPRHTTSWLRHAHLIPTQDNTSYRGGYLACVDDDIMKRPQSAMCLLQCRVKVTTPRYHINSCALQRAQPQRHQHTRYIPRRAQGGQTRWRTYLVGGNTR
jgi:hypothetical protein